MGKLIITHVTVDGKNLLFRGLHKENRFCDIGLNSGENTEHENDYVGDDKAGNIYVGFVKDIVKNINAAFVEYQKGKIGYFSIADEEPIFLNNKANQTLCQGDLVLVQLKKEAVKTKAPVLTSKISFSGRYIVLNVSKSGVGFSNKIGDHDFKTEVRKSIARLLDDIFHDTGEKYGVVIRTNAIEADAGEIEKELIRLVNNYREMLENAKYKTRFSVIKKEEPQYLKMITGAYDNEIDEIITDDLFIYQKVKDYILCNEIEKYKEIIRLYDDKLLPLHKIYSVEKTVKEIRNKKVWLNSGAYLVIEQTEAMVVIDVNTGKCIKGKDIKKTILNVNLEAAKEIAYQLRLRNLSGIIMIDFISMTDEEDKKKVVDCVKKCIRNDKVRTDFVEMTKLDLVELTRKKIEPPVYEQIERIIDSVTPRDRYNQL